MSSGPASKPAQPALSKTAESRADHKWIVEYVDQRNWKQEWGVLREQRVVTALDVNKWTQVFFVSPNAVLLKTTDPHVHHMAGRKLFIVCPTRWFTDIMLEVFGSKTGSPYPPCPREGCPHKGSNKCVQSHGFNKDIIHVVFHNELAMRRVPPSCAQEVSTVDCQT